MALKGQSSSTGIKRTLLSQTGDALRVHVTIHNNNFLITSMFALIVY